MNEDERFNEALKAALEDGVQVRPGVLAAVASAAGRAARRRQAVRLMWRWVPASLLAASVAIAAAMWAIVWSSGSETEVAEAIGLLRALDGEVGDQVEMSAGEALLAWQEAPCGDIGFGEM